MRILLTFAACFALASAAALLVLPRAVLLASGVLLCIWSMIFLLRRRISRMAIAALGFSLGIFWCTGYQMLQIDPALGLVGQTAEISGVAADYSVGSTGGIRVDAHIAVGDIKTTAAVWLATEEPLSPGDRFNVEAKL